MTFVWEATCLSESHDLGNAVDVWQWNEFWTHSIPVFGCLLQHSSDERCPSLTTARFKDAKMEMEKKCTKPAASIQRVHSFESVSKYTEDCQNSLDGMLLSTSYLDFVAISNYSFKFCCLACIAKFIISCTKILQILGEILLIPSIWSANGDSGKPQFPILKSHPNRGRHWWISNWYCPAHWLVGTVAPPCCIHFSKSCWDLWVWRDVAGSQFDWWQVLGDSETTAVADGAFTSWCKGTRLRFYLEDKSKVVWDCVHRLRLDAAGLSCRV